MNLDINVKMFESMYHDRLRAYKKTRLLVIIKSFNTNTLEAGAKNINSIFDEEEKIDDMDHPGLITGFSIEDDGEGFDK